MVNFAVDGDNTNGLAALTVGRQLPSRPFALPAVHDAATDDFSVAGGNNTTMVAHLDADVGNLVPTAPTDPTVAGAMATAAQVQAEQLAAMERAIWARMGQALNARIEQAVTAQMEPVQQELVLVRGENVWLKNEVASLDRTIQNQFISMDSLGGQASSAEKEAKKCKEELQQAKLQVSGLERQVSGMADKIADLEDQLSKAEAQGREYRKLLGINKTHGKMPVTAPIFDKLRNSQNKQDRKLQEQDQKIDNQGQILEDQTRKINLVSPFAIHDNDLDADHM